MKLHTTVTAAQQTVTNLAWDSIPIPGLGEKLNTFGGWVTFLAYFACGIAIVASGGYIAFDYITDGHNRKGVKIAVSAVVGAAVVASGLTIIAP
jgi:hypothetical protein